jgi:hypothetical protein
MKPKIPDSSIFMKLTTYQIQAPNTSRGNEKLKEFTKEEYQFSPSKYQPITKSNKTKKIHAPI